MSSEEIFEKVKSIIVEQLGVTETSVTMEASFIDDLGADSLDIVELIMALDELEKERGKGEAVWLGARGGSPARPIQ